MIARNQLDLLIQQLRAKGLIVRKVQVPELNFSFWHVATRSAVKQRKTKGTV